MKINIIIICISIFSLCSCRTTRNLKKADIKTDSAQVVRKDSGIVKNEKSIEQGATKVTIVTEEKKDRTVTTTVEEYKVPDSAKEVALVRRTTIVDVNKGIKKSERTKTDSTHKSVAKSDSSYANKSDSARLIKDEKTKLVDTVKTSGGGWINAGLVLLALIIIGGVGYYFYKNQIMKFFIFLLLLSANCLGQNRFEKAAEDAARITDKQLK